MNTYRFSAKVWRYPGPAGWHFVTLPKRLSGTIRKQNFMSEEGWGRMPVTATIQDTSQDISWKTAMWFDTKAGAFLLPLKASVRKKREISAGDKVTVELTLKVDDFRTPAPLR